MVPFLYTPFRWRSSLDVVIPPRPIGWLTHHQPNNDRTMTVFIYFIVEPSSSFVSSLAGVLRVVIDAFSGRGAASANGFALDIALAGGKFFPFNLLSTADAVRPVSWRCQ